MSELDDHQLLAEFARNHTETAFTVLVQRHLNLVYATALRCLGQTHAAEEVASAVFIILAQKAGKLSPRVVLSGWLYQTARLTAANYLRGELRRQKREQEAYMQSTLNDTDVINAWAQIAPLLDDALAKLGTADRNAIVLRYLEDKSLAEVGAALGASEDAAKMRVNRALEKLRRVFRKQGVTLSATLIASAVSAGSVHSAPAGLAVTISTVAATQGAVVSSSTLALVKGALKIMAWTKMKTVAAVGVSMLLAAGTATLVVEKIMSPKLSATDLAWADNPYYWGMDFQVLNGLPPVFILRPTKLPEVAGGIQLGQKGAGHFDKLMFRNVNLEFLTTTAFEQSAARCIFPPEMQHEHYDLMFTLREDFHPRLKMELDSRFGVTAHMEKRITDVWLLRVKVPDAAGLKRAAGTDHRWIGSQYGAKIYGHQIADLIGWLEVVFGRPVLNQTKLAGELDMDLQWKPRAGQSEPDALRQALLDQLGLELVPGRELLDLLVVEKAK